MENLRVNLNKLIKKTLEIEDFSVCNPRLQSQPMYESETVIIKEEIQQVPEKSQDSSQTNKIINRNKIKYTTNRIKFSSTRIKSRNFLSNISYTGIVKNAFYNENFILDVFVLLVKNLNPFLLNRKITDKTKHEMVYILWRECIPQEFYKYICEEQNFMFLNGRDINKAGVLKIVGNFIDQGKKTLDCFKNTYQGIKI